MFKDTAEGQTHFYGDGCKEHAVEPMSGEEILKEFANKFPHVYPATSSMIGKHFTDLPEFITDWLRSALAAHTAWLMEKESVKKYPPKHAYAKTKTQNEKGVGGVHHTL